MVEVFVSGIADEAELIKKFHLKRVDGGQLPSYVAGSHIGVETPGGVTRQYSLCGDPRDRDVFTIAVKKELESRGGSLSMHEQLNLGDRLTISEPKCLFKLSEKAGRHILIAAGIGITPLLSMAYECNIGSFAYQLHYYSRGKDQAAFLSEFSAADFVENVSLKFGFSQEEVRNSIESILQGALPTDHIYTCGPGPFMDLVISVANEYLPSDQVHKEFFQSNSLVTSCANKSFQAKLGQSGIVVTVDPGESLISALAKVGVEIPMSCGEGICGTCLIPVMSGDIDHRDSFLSPEEVKEGGVMCACVSRALSEVLVLDL
ncbi:TPA: oxidoreductase [Pseudomonas aeruginosa]|nr:oxidoreductase [Pseudomonas aeruginosa]